MLDNTDKIRDILTFDSPQDFYIMQIIKRRKDIPDLKRTSKIYKEIYITSLAFFDEHIENWIETAERERARIYINLNRRNMEKMGVRCLHQLSKYLLSGQYDAIPYLFSKTVGKYCDEEAKRWVVDVDDREFVPTDVIECIEDLQNEITKKDYEILAVLPTHSGYHIISQPFNVQKFKSIYSDIEIHKNSPTLLYKP